MNQKSRRKFIVQRSIIYLFMTLAVIFGVVFALGWAMGFRFDLKSGQISQVALIQFDSFPQGAQISVNGALIASQTPSRLNVDLGQKNITISRIGYRDWKTSVKVAPSEVLWLNYARLVPENVKTASVKDFANFADAKMLASPDKKNILLDFANLNDFSLVNIEDPTKPKFANLKLDSAKISAPAEGQTEKFFMVEWDENSRFLLISHEIFGTDGTKISTEFLELDSENNSFDGSNSRNLTKDFGVDLSEPHFFGGNENIFLAKTEQNLRKFDYGNKSISAPLAENVTNFQVFDDKIFTFVSRKNSADGKISQEVGIYNDGKIILAKTFADEISTRAIFAKNEGKDFLAISRNSDLEIYEKPLENLENAENAENFAKIKTTKIAISFAPNNFAKSPSGRFLFANSGEKMFVYDLETGEKYEYKMDFAAENFAWLDDFHLISDGGKNAVSIVDFSGENRQKIADGYGNAALSADGKFLFSLKNSVGNDGKTRVNFQRSEMTVE